LKPAPECECGNPRPCRRCADLAKRLHEFLPRDNVSRGKPAAMASKPAGEPYYAPSPAPTILGFGWPRRRGQTVEVAE